MDHKNIEIKNNNAGQGMAIAAMVLGILGVIIAFIPCVGIFAIIFVVLSICFGTVGYSQAKKENAQSRLPLIALILGVISTVFVLIWPLFFATSMISTSTNLRKINQVIHDDIQDSLEETPEDTHNRFTEE